MFIGRTDADPWGRKESDTAEQLNKKMFKSQPLGSQNVALSGNRVIRDVVG